jgi:hypothetical protein
MSKAAIWPWLGVPVIAAVAVVSGSRQVAGVGNMENLTNPIGVVVLAVIGGFVGSRFQRVGTWGGALAGAGLAFTSALYTHYQQTHTPAAEAMRNVKTQPVSTTPTAGVWQ